MKVNGRLLRDRKGKIRYKENSADLMYDEYWNVSMPVCVSTEKLDEYKKIIYKGMIMESPKEEKYRLLRPLYLVNKPEHVVGHASIDDIC